jgi:hypothetical protein
MLRQHARTRHPAGAKRDERQKSGMMRASPDQIGIFTAEDAEDAEKTSDDEVTDYRVHRPFEANNSRPQLAPISED